MTLGSATTMIAFAATPRGPDGRPDVPGGYGPQGPGAYGPQVPGGYGPQGPADYGYGTVVPGQDRYGPQGQDRYAPAVPAVPGYEVNPRQYDVPGYPAEVEGVLSIDSANVCKLYPANNTVSARGECTMNKSCIVQQRRARTEAQWRDSIGNPTPREQGEEYRPFCR